MPGDNTPPSDGTLESSDNVRTVRRPMPNIPDRLPDYSLLGKGHQESINMRFEADGTPKIASAREIAPAEDDPMPWWQRIGASIAYVSVNGRKLWPLNVRHNVLLFYLTGRIQLYVSDYFFALLPWLLLIGADISLALYLALVGRYSNFHLMFGVTLLVFTLFLNIWSKLLMVHHFSRVTQLIPFEEISLTRLEPHEIMYGLLMRPHAVQHFLNLFGNLLAFTLYSGTIIWLFFESLQNGSLMGFAPQWIMFILILLFFRTLLGILAINWGMASSLCSLLRAPTLSAGYGRIFRESLNHLFGLAFWISLAYLGIYWYNPLFWGFILAPFIIIIGVKILIYFNNEAIQRLYSTSKDFKRWAIFHRD